MLRRKTVIAMAMTAVVRAVVLEVTLMFPGPACQFARTKNSAAGPQKMENSTRQCHLATSHVPQPAGLSHVVSPVRPL